MLSLKRGLHLQCEQLNTQTFNPKQMEWQNTERNRSVYLHLHTAITSRTIVWVLFESLFQQANCC